MFFKLFLTYCHASYLLKSIFFKLELGNKTIISYLSVQQSNYHPLHAVDDPMNCCPRPSVLGNSSSGHPQYLEGDSFDCCTERYEIVVCCYISNIVIIFTIKTCEILYFSFSLVFLQVKYKYENSLLGLLCEEI